MNRIRLTLLGLALGLALPAAVLAQPALSPVPERITDGAIHRDYLAYEAQQAKLKALNASGRFSLASYAMAKAQCWLDVSLHEYTRNDRSAFAQEALQQSFLITQQLQGQPVAGQPDAIATTPRVADAALLRPDLWERVQTLKAAPASVCVQQRMACAEVELVHAGHVFNKHQWRGALPYVQMAEDGLEAAAKLAGRCGAQH